MAEATGELLEARSWCAAIRPELGEHFAQAVTATVQAVAENPERFAAVYRGFRRAGVRRFPYGLIFEVQEEVRSAGFWCWRASMANATRGAGNRGLLASAGFGWGRMATRPAHFL